MTTYAKLAEKFIDKGYIYELHWFVLPPPIMNASRLINPSREKFNEIVQEVYGKDWEYWDTWIDRQKHK